MLIKKRNSRYPCLTSGQIRAQKRENNRLLSALLSRRGSYGIPRDMRHNFSFPDAARRDQCRDFLERGGYSPEETAAGLLVTTNSVMEKTIVDAVTLTLSDIAASFGGRYDGWQAPNEKRP